ncbi:MAG: hypothetical protein E5W94_31410 [Mesorhizobium sp.]|nr:MAG: hypothetical protein E5W94_31410 [Mesorhizobium sp.]
MTKKPTAPAFPLSKIIKGRLADTRLHGNWRYETDPKPIVSPPFSRRMGALLWVFVERYSEEGMAVGSSRCPPYTRDLQSLVHLGLLTLRREFPGRNVLRISASGRTRLSQLRVSEADKLWVLRAIGEGALR